MINDLKLIDNIDVLLDNKIVLYGASGGGVIALKMLKEAGLPAPAYFCDGDPRKWGAFVDGVEVLSLSELKRLDETEKLAIIIASYEVRFLDQIAEDIAWLELRTDNVFTLFGLTVSLLRNNKASELKGGHYIAALEMYSDSFLTAWTSQRFNAYVRWAEKTNVFLIYSFPKTGNNTFLRSLSKVGIEADVFHMLTEIQLRSHGELLARHWQNMLNILKSRKSVKIISMVRDPVGIILSHFFEIIGKFQSQLLCMPSGKSFINSVAELMISPRQWEIFNLYKPDYKPIDWFDKELKAVFDIDVYAHPFDREKGYSIIKRGNAEALVMKLEKLNSLEQVIAEFVGVPRFELLDHNVGDNKPYKYLYKQVKEAIKIPRELFDFYYKDLRMAHFYSEEEIAGFWKKWEKNIAD